MAVLKHSTLLVLSGLLLAGFGGACNGGTDATGTSRGPDGGVSDGSAGGGDAAPEASLSAVQAIFDLHCTICHDASKHGLPTYPSLSLVSGDSYAALVGKVADETCGGLRVVAGAPDQSYLVQKITPGVPCSGAHMPRPFEVGPQVDLTATEMATIRAWIAAGAPP